MIRPYRDFLLPTGLLAGTIIGAGVFALPYLFERAGILTGLFYLALGALIYTLVHLFYADVILRTPGEHRFVGYAEIYLGRKFKWLAILMAVLEMILVMTIYLILSLSFANLIAPGNGIYKLLVFWILGSLAIFLSVRRLTLVEFLISWGMIAIILLIFILGLPKFNQVSAPDFYPRSANILLPLSAVLFSLGGRVAIPSLVKYFKLPGIGHNYGLIKKSVIWGTVIPAVTYALFVFGILGLSGVVSEDSVTGLIGQVPNWLLAVIGILGILSLWSSYIVVGLDVSNTLLYDLKLNKFVRIAAVVFAPLILYFLSSQNFIALVSFTGGIFLALEGIFIIVMWVYANRLSEKPPLLVKKINPAVTVVALLIFAIALTYEILKKFL